MKDLVAAVVTLFVVVSCGGRSAPPDEDPFAQDAGGDGAAGYGGTLAATDATLSYDATIARAIPPAEGLDAGPGDDTASDDSPADSPSDDGGDDACTADLTPGALLIDELMIESVDGTGDHGEWLEVENTLACAVDLRGLHGECPHGAKAATFDVVGDLWVPAGSWFVVADSVSPAINHDIPLPVVAWAGNLGDVLRNKGTTVTLSLNDVVIDTLTYPALTLTVGTSMAFPSDCDPSMRDDFSLWQPSMASWFPGFHGTPNAPNSDVACPM
jgi:hypothetical protein